MKKLIHIFKGWAKAIGLISTTTAEKKLSDLRLAKCRVCRKAKPSTFLEIINGNAVEEHRLLCTECSCPCLEKSLVIEERCPLDKW